MLYRKKPVVVEAFKWTGGPDPEDDPVWVVNAIRAGIIYIVPHQPPVLLIRTLEGEMTAQVGDYIIKGTKGELYPCKPDIFEDIYEAA